MSKAITDAGEVFPIACIGKDKQGRVFYVHSHGEVAEEGAGVVEFRVRAEPFAPASQQDDGRFFLLQLEPAGESVWKIKNITHQYEQAFVERGIPDALLPAIADRYKVEIRSQRAGRSDQQADAYPAKVSGGFRVESGGDKERDIHATHMWERLERNVKKYRAEFDEREQCFRLFVAGQELAPTPIGGHGFDADFAASLVKDTDEGSFKPLRAEVAVAVEFDHSVTDEQRYRIRQHLESLLNEMKQDGCLFPPELEIPNPQFVRLMPLPHECGHCGQMVSPFLLS